MAGGEKKTEHVNTFHSQPARPLHGSLFSDAENGSKDFPKILEWMRFRLVQSIVSLIKHAHEF